MTFIGVWRAYGRNTAAKGLKELELARAEKPAARFMIRHRIRVVKRHPEGDW